MALIKKIFLAIYDEFTGIFLNFVTYYPDTRLGLKMRKLYYKSKFKQCGSNLNLMKGFRASCPEKIVVGERFSCNNFTYLNCGSCNGIYFGNNVALGPNVYIRTANHNYNNKNLDVRDQGYQEKKISYKGNIYSVVFEGNNWVGANVIILPGTHVKQGAIIGAGTVVSGKIKENGVYVQNPPILAFNRSD